MGQEATMGLCRAGNDASSVGINDARSVPLVGQELVHVRQGLQVTFGVCTRTGTSNWPAWLVATFISVWSHESYAWARLVPKVK